MGGGRGNNQHHDSLVHSASSNKSATRRSGSRKGGLAREDSLTSSVRGSLPSLEGRTALEQVKILKEELTRQRRLNIDLEKQVKQYKKAQGNKQLERAQEEVERLQEEKEQLSKDLEESESIRNK
jgi:hypothetical protein